MRLLGIFDHYPSAYVRKLKQEGKRGLASAFMEFFDDYLMGDIQSVRFYAVRWTADGNRKRKGAGMSVSMAHAWIEQFTETIEGFKFHLERNFKHQERSAKVSIEHLSHNHRTDKPTTTKALQDASEQSSNTYRTKSTYINNNNKETNPNQNEAEDQKPDHSLLDYSFKLIWGAYAKHSPKSMGKRSEAYKAYLEIKDNYKAEDIARAIKHYIHDKDRVVDGEKRLFNVANFLRNLAFAPYLARKVKFTTNDGKQHEGTYSPADELVTTKTERLKLTQDKASELIRSKRLVYVDE